MLKATTRTTLQMDSLRSYFDARALAWNRELSADADARLRDILASFNADLAAARTILDVGTGVGVLIPYLRAYAPHANLVSVDLAHEMLAQARIDHAGARVV